MPAPAKKAATKPAAVKAEPKAAKPAAVKPAKTETKAEKVLKPAAEKVKKPSAASRFKELILAGKLTDDEIFSKVSEEFGLDESKRTYVAWYRNSMKKEGIEVPPQKAAKK